MKLRTTATALSLGGLALASSSPEPAEAYLLTDAHPHTVSSQLPPSLPRELARHIILSHLSFQSSDRIPLSGLPIPATDAVDALNALGLEPQGLFDSPRHPHPSLVIMLQGADASAAAPLKSALTETFGVQAPSFKVADPPTFEANARLFDDVGTAVSPCNELDHKMGYVLQSGDGECWAKGESLAAVVDVAQKPWVIPSIVSRLGKLRASMGSERLSVLLILVPPTAPGSSPESWSSGASAKRPTEPSELPSELRRRVAQEAVMEDALAAASHAASGAQHKQSQSQSQSSAHVFASARKTIPACFSTVSACTNGTNSCSGHGECVNKYGENSKNTCFVCQCQIIENADGRSRTFWAGRACNKQDVSTAFWLLAGLSIVLVSLVTFSIGMLFNVGEEKLPGVIGAGVSRPGK